MFKWQAAWPFVVAIVWVILDQISKQYVEANFELYRTRVEFIPHLDFIKIYNKGAAFSFLAEQSGWQRWFLTGMSLVASVIFSVWITRVQNNNLLKWALCLLLGGAAGNLIDRALFGYVIDFVDFYVGDWHFPTFNIADIGVSIGVFFLILDSFINEEQTPKTKKENKA